MGDEYQIFPQSKAYDHTKPLKTYEYVEMTKATLLAY